VRLAKQQRPVDGKRPLAYGVAAALPMAVGLLLI
jgi:hypothetical protein